MLEKLKIPRTRQKTGKKLAKQIRKAYRKQKEEIHRLLREMFLAGASTARTGEIAQILLGRKYSASYVSCATKKLDAAVKEYHNRPLADRFVYLFFDGIVLKGRDMLGAKDRFVLVCHGIDLEGRRELLDFMIEESESEACWTKFCNNLYQRGLEGKILRLVITDGCPGLHAALDMIWPRVTRQRCWVHKLRNMATKFQRKVHQEKCMFEAKLIYLASNKQEAKERFLQWEKNWETLEPKVVNCLKKDLNEMLNFLDSPKEHRRRIRTTNVIERVFREVRRRIRPMNCFKNDASCERILYAIFFYMNRRWMWKKIGDWETEKKILSSEKAVRHPLELIPV
jgi:putative transposase